MSRTSQSNNSADGLEDTLIEKEGIALFKRILEGRNEMHDYVTSTLQRGGYNHRQICSLFEVDTITVKFFGSEKVVVESPQKTIIFENQKLYVRAKHFPT